MLMVVLQQDRSLSPLFFLLWGTILVHSFTHHKMCGCAGLLLVGILKATITASIVTTKRSKMNSPLR